ncbi:MAG: endonuclease domain-containing protein, partial [Actinomycetota bacterium]|nr:endonuclease domain-containing protein [Actinomycetota bacterium]
MRSLVAGFFDLGGRGFVAGRSGARLHGLDGFTSDDVELVVPRRHRGLRCPGTLRSTARAIGNEDVQTIDGMRVLRAERLILDSPLFEFTREETENAIDSAIRKRLVAEQRLRTRVIERHSAAINGGRILLDALVDSGGESRLERWFLRIVRDAGVARPILQKTFRSDGRTVARVDAFFPGGLVVELAGHGTHSSRLQRQHDAQRHTELTIRGMRVLTFTYEDVRDR